MKRHIWRDVTETIHPTIKHDFGTLRVFKCPRCESMFIRTPPFPSNKRQFEFHTGVPFDCDEAVVQKIMKL